METSEIFLLTQVFILQKVQSLESKCSSLEKKVSEMQESWVFSLMDVGHNVLELMLGVE